MSTVVRCSTNLSVGLSASRDTQLVRPHHHCSVLIVLNLSEAFPVVDLQLGAAGLHRLGRGWCGRHGARGHLVAPRHHWGRQGRWRAGLPARAEGDVAGIVRHQGTQAQWTSAGGQVGPRGLRTPGGRAVDLVSHVTLQDCNQNINTTSDYIKLSPSPWSFL